MRHEPIFLHQDQYFITLIVLTRHFTAGRQKAYINTHLYSMPFTTGDLRSALPNRIIEVNSHRYRVTMKLVSPHTAIRRYHAKLKTKRQRRLWREGFSISFQHWYANIDAYIYLRVISFPSERYAMPYFSRFNEADECQHSNIWCQGYI